jgi:hypothetical protein
MSQHPDQRIDQVLNSLRNTQPRAGLEARIAARVAARFNRTSPQPAIPWFRSAWPIAATTAAALLIAAAITLHTTKNLSSRPEAAPFATSSNLSSRPEVAPFATSSNLSSRPEAAHFAAVAERPAVRTTTDPSTPEALALTETLAPSQPAPAMPLTSQERLLASITRPGQPIELAELELAQKPALNISAQSRERADIDRYVHAVLSSLVLSESLNPTPTAQPTDFQPTPFTTSTSTN